MNKKYFFIILVLFFSMIPLVSADVTIYAKDNYTNTNLTNFSAVVDKSNTTLNYQPFSNITNWFKLDDYNQSALNTVNNNNGILSGYTLKDGTVSLATLATGKQGNYSYNFSTNSAKIDLGTTLNYGGNITFEAWLYPTSNASTTAIYGSWAGGYVNFVLFDTLNLVPRITIYNNSVGSAHSSTGYLSLNQWNHLAITFTDKTYTFYVNGITKGTGTISGAGVPVYGGTATIGHRGDSPNDEWIGLIDEVRLYNRVLSSTEINNDMSSAYPINNNKLIASYSFESTNSLNITKDTNYLVAGQIEGGYGFKASLNQYVTLKTADAELFDSQTTFNTWLYPSTPTTMSFFSKITAYSNYLILDVNNNDLRVSGANASTALNTHTWSNIISRNNWQMITLVFNGNQVSLYVNGTFVSTKTMGASLPKFNDDNELGSRSDSRANGWTGNIDDFRIYSNITLSSSDITNLYLSGKYKIYNYSTTTGIINTNLPDSTYNATISSTENNGYFDSTYLNLAMTSSTTTSLSQSINTFYAREKVTNNLISTANFTTSYLTNVTHYMRAQNYNVTATATGYRNITFSYTPTALVSTIYTVYNMTDLEANISLRNIYGNSSITNFNVTLTSGSYTETNISSAGLTKFYIVKSALYNITIVSDTYYPVTLLNVNLSSNLTAYTYQSIVTFVAKEKVTNNTISGANFTIGSTTNVTHYLNASNYNVTASKTGYYNKTVEVTAYPLTSSTEYIYNLSYATFNISVKDNLTNLSLSNFTYILNSLNYTWNETAIANGTTIQTELINGSYNITLSKSGYAPNTFTFTINSSETINKTYGLYAANSVLFSFFNQSSLAALSNQTITLTFTSGSILIINTTTQSTFFASALSAGIYNVSVAAAGFTTSNYILTIGNNTFQTLAVYLVPSSSNNVVFTTQDINTAVAIQGVFYLVETKVNGTYAVVNSYFSDISGLVQFNYVTGQTYRFTASKSGYATRQFELNPIIFTSYTINLEQNNQQPNIGDFSSISVQTLPSVVYNNLVNNFSLNLAAPSGNMIAYTVNISSTLNVTPIILSGTNAYGGILNGNINITGATLNDKIYFKYTYMLSDGQLHSFENVMDIVTNYSNTLANNSGNPQNVPLLERVIIMVFATIFVAGVVFWFGGPLPAGLAGIAVLGYFTAMKFLPVWITIPSIIVGLIVAWRMGSR